MKQNKLLKPLLAVLLLALLPQAAAAYDFMVGGLCYNRNSDGISVTVTYQNYSSYSPFYSNLSGNLVIPATVTYSGTTYSVTSIDNYAFRYCSGLTSVTIPNSVTSIGYWAFEGCSGLTSVTIPNSVTSIGVDAFSGCSGLTSVTIPNSVTSIGGSAFAGCSGLESMVVEAGNTKYDSRDNCNAIIETASNTLVAGCKATTIPNSVTSIGSEAFYNCSGLTSVTIPNSVTSIGSSAFYGCSGLTSVTIPNSVTSIGFCAFYGCSGLTEATIPNSVTSIGGSAFYRCSGLTSVTIGNSVTSIGGSAFAYCSGLESMVVEAGNTKYDSRDNCNAIIETASNTLVAGCKATTIPNSVTAIGDYAFCGCSGLTEVTIPNSVTYIGHCAFEGCSGLTSVTIPNSVTSIGEYAFAGCSGLTSVTIPNSVTSIGSSAFYYCRGLRSIHSEISDPANVQLGSTVFYYVPKSTCVLVVPAASLESYQSTSQWNEFTNIFAEMTSLDISEQSFELMKRKKQAIDVMTQPDNAWNQFVWTSSDSSVATVDEIGTVTAVSPGTATITAKYIFDSNLSDSCLVKVIPNYDVNDDDKVDIADVSLLINKMLEKNGALSMEYTDINGDSIVDIFDINEVISAMLGNGNLPEPPISTQTYTVNGVTFSMIGVNGGTFTMGATAEQGSDAFDSERPAHQVTLSNYRIGQTEVTQKLWQAVMGSNPSHFTGDLQRPVECVSWDDCQTFITKLNQLTGKNFRLPTEAEWEYAARGGNQSQGYKYAGSNNVDEVAWCVNNGNSTTHTVATKAANELGIYDMSGNVLEWCQDWYGSYSSDAQTNPTGPASGTLRIFRGGSYVHTNIGCNRVSWRSAADPTKKYINMGFRLAL